MTPKTRHNIYPLDARPFARRTGQEIMVAIRKHGNKWYIDYYDESGKRIVRPVSRDKATAETVRKEIEVKKHLGDLQKSKKIVSIRRAAEEYFHAMAEIRRPKTIRTSKGRLYNLIDSWEEKGITDLPDIEPRSLLKFRQEFLKTHTPLTYNYYLEVIKAFLNWVVREHPDYLKINPLAMAERIKGAYAHKPRYFSREQLEVSIRSLTVRKCLASCAWPPMSAIDPMS